MKTMAPKIVGPRALAAPMHLHTREDEYSYVPGGTGRRALRFPGEPM